MAISAVRRIVGHHTAYFLLATVSLAFAMGATLSVFTIVNALWLRPLPFSDPQQLVVLMAADANGGPGESATFGGLESVESWGAFQIVAGQAVTSGHLSGLRPRVSMEGDRVDREAVGVTSQYFRLLGVPLVGRDFRREDNRSASEPVAIISHRLWETLFGGRSEVIGAVVPARPIPLRIIGVAPAGFTGARRGEHIDIWVPSNLVRQLSPAVAQGTLEDGVPSLVFARLQAGDTAASALERFVGAAPDERARSYRKGIRLVPLAQAFGTLDSKTILVQEGRAARTVACLAGLVLLGGCTTLVALVLVHYERRRPELALRIALGASRRQLSFALALELCVVAVAGTLGAFFVGGLWLRAMPALSLPGGVNLARLDLTPDWRVVGFTILGVISSLALAAVVPVRRFTRHALANELVAPSATPPQSSHRFRQCLLAVHVAATIVVLIAAGLFVRAVILGFGEGPGYDVGHTMYLSTQVASPFAGPGTDFAARSAAMVEHTRRIGEGLRVLPGVDAVSLGQSPIGPDQAASLNSVKDIQVVGGHRQMAIGILSGGPELSRALGLSIVRGRQLIAEDATALPMPALITESLARVLWPGEDPLGQTLRPGFRECSCVVVGVVRDLVYGSLSRPATGVVVTLKPNGFGLEPAYVIHAQRPELLVDAIRGVVRDVVPDTGHLAASTGRDLIAEDLASQRLGAWFFSGFGLIALTLGAGGVFGLVGYAADARRREFGIRLALGATPRHVIELSMSSGLFPVGLGALFGLVAARITARTLISQVGGLTPLDPVVYLSVAVIMALCAVAAALAAAWRLRRVSPNTVLRMG